MLSLATLMISVPKMVLVKPCLWVAEGLTALVVHHVLVRLGHSGGIDLFSYWNKNGVSGGIRNGEHGMEEEKEGV